jgi:hypothetical protein
MRDPANCRRAPVMKPGYSIANRFVADKLPVMEHRDDNAEPGPSDTLIRHRDILKSRSLLEQGLALAKILFVMLVLFAKLKIVGWLDARRAQPPKD